MTFIELVRVLESSFYQQSAPSFEAAFARATIPLLIADGQNHFMNSMETKSEPGTLSDRYEWPYGVAGLAGLLPPIDPPRYWYACPLCTMEQSYYLDPLFPKGHLEDPGHGNVSMMYLAVLDANKDRLNAQLSATRPIRLTDTDLVKFSNTFEQKIDRGDHLAKDVSGGTADPVNKYDGACEGWVVALSKVNSRVRERCQALTLGQVWNGQPNLEVGNHAALLASKAESRAVEIYTTTSPSVKTVGFSSSPSTDPLGTIKEYHWEFGDGTTWTGTTAILIKTYADFGTYAVHLTRTYADAHTDTATTVVTLRDGGLQNGVTTLYSRRVILNSLGLKVLQGTRYMYVPWGATSLTFETSNLLFGDGADMYIKFGAQPVASSYNCRSMLPGGQQTCTIPHPAAGLWYVEVVPAGAIPGVFINIAAEDMPNVDFDDPQYQSLKIDLTGTYTLGTVNSPGSLIIPTLGGVVERPIVISGLDGNAPDDLQVHVAMNDHCCVLQLELVGPSGRVYPLDEVSFIGDRLEDIYTVNASKEVANGTWRLRALLMDEHADDPIAAWWLESPQDGWSFVERGGTIEIR